MNSFFDELGRKVLERWRRENFSLKAFPEIAHSSIEESSPSKQVNLDELIRDFLLDDEQPLQSQSDFGQPELIVFHHDRFYIQILFWLEGTTDIHQHEFSGAFHVLAGSSIHAQFEFNDACSVTPHMRIGNLQMKQIELLETGRTIALTSGRDCIHSLFHLDTPSVTLVVRTQHDPGTGPQFNYLPPHIAVDPMQVDNLTMRRKQLLDVVDADFAHVVSEMVENLDFERGFHILNHAMIRLQELGDWEAVLEAFQQRHGDLADGVADTLAESLRRDVVASMRFHIEDPEHRFFLALLMNVLDRGEFMKLVAERFPDQSPADTIVGWAEELIEPDESGLMMLDAVFPDSLEASDQEQIDLFTSVLRHGLDDAECPQEFAAVRESLSNSVFRYLVNP
ncbi:MAG: hypothetical protein AAF585_11840 [Verrucomicrobiota bacterium]